MLGVVAFLATVIAIAVALGAIMEICKFDTEWRIIISLAWALSVYIMADVLFFQTHAS